MKFQWDGRIVRSELVVPDHLCGWNRLIHGGVTSTILDEVMSWAAIHTSRKMVMTKTMTIDFLKPVHIGEHIRAEGRVTETTGRNALITQGEIFNDTGEICVRARGDFAVFTQKVAKRLGIIHPDTPDPFSEKTVV